MELMTEEQLDRYEAFRRSAIDKLKIKRVCTSSQVKTDSEKAPSAIWLMQVLQTISGHNVSAPMVTVVRGMAKVFVGELVEAGEMFADGSLSPLWLKAYSLATACSSTYCA